MALHIHGQCEQTHDETSSTITGPWFTVELPLNHQVLCATRTSYMLYSKTVNKEQPQTLVWRSKTLSLRRVSVRGGSVKITVWTGRIEVQVLSGVATFCTGEGDAILHSCGHHKTVEGSLKDPRSQTDPSFRGGPDNRGRRSHGWCARLLRVWSTWPGVSHCRYASADGHLHRQRVQQQRLLVP